MRGSVGVPDALSRSRRGFLAAAACLLLAPRTRAHDDAGPVSPPQAAPDSRLELDDGKNTKLGKQLAGHVTALQMVFTRCRATCPIQGALFASVERELGDALPEARLLSVSIDPEHDDPKVLRAWLQRYDAGARWRAARTPGAELSALLDFLKARASGPDKHTAQVYYFDRAGKLAFRSVDFPSAGDVVSTLRKLRAG